MLQLLIAAFIALASFSSYAENQSSEDTNREQNASVRCEVLLQQPRWNVTNAALTFHKNLTNKSFRIFDVNGHLEMEKALGVDKLSNRTFEKLEARVEEVPDGDLLRQGDYALTLFYKSRAKEHIVSVLYFNAPPLRLWTEFPGTPRAFDAFLAASNAEPSEIKVIATEESVLIAPLKSKSPFELYVRTAKAPGTDVTVLEIGTYLDCKSQVLRSLEEHHMIRTDAGWRCVAPILKFVSGVNPF